MNVDALQTGTVRDAMSQVNTVPAGLTMAAAAELLRATRGRALVVDSGEDSPAIFTEFDVVKAVAGGVSDGATVGDHHTRIAISATPDWSLERALATMMRGQFRHLVVMEDGDVVGMLAMRDILDQVIEDDHPVHEPFDPGATVEFSMRVSDEAGRLLHSLRRSAKQHRASIKCDCELDWIEILVGQVEERDDISMQDLEALWNQRPLCPTLYAMGGSGD